jgi:hypothetical protein
VVERNLKIVIRLQNCAQHTRERERCIRVFWGVYIQVFLCRVNYSYLHVLRYIPMYVHLYSTTNECVFQIKTLAFKNTE